MQPGARLGGRYELRREIGWDGLGRVFHAWDLHLGRPVTVLLALPGRSQRLRVNPAAVARLRAEAQVAATLRHRALAAVYDVVEDPVAPAVVTEFVEGETLGAWLARGARWTPEAVAALLAPVCEGLARAHAVGLVHRGISPTSLLVSATGGVKLAGFGLAHVMLPEALARGGTSGVTAYLAPEVVGGSPGDARADLWSVGAVGFEMISGVRPFERPTHALGAPGQRAEPAWHRFPWPASPVAPVLQRALAANPAWRSASAADLAASLHRVSGNGAGPALRAARSRLQAPTAGAPPRGAVLAAGGLVTAALTLVATVLVLLGGGAPATMGGGGGGAAGGVDGAGGAGSRLPGAFRLSPMVVAYLAAEIADAGGNEVAFVATVDPGGRVVSARAVARGTPDMVLAPRGTARAGEMVLHNHPSGPLLPSPPDLAAASRLSAQGIGFGIINNQATALYVVVEVPQWAR